tara:strand:- start:1782 stop:1961 length:180 start_codon:yes stop_codon:yes gene_type:complete
MKNKIKKLNNGDFEVVNTSYDVPITYKFNRMRKGVERRRLPNHTSGYCIEYSFYRNNGD